MTGAHAQRSASRRPALHLPSIIGRARADWGSLLLTGVVVTLAVLLGAAVPPAERSTADAAVADGVRHAGAAADVIAAAPFERDDTDGGGRLRVPGSAALLDTNLRLARLRIGARLAAASSPPVVTSTSVVLGVNDGSLLRTFQLAYVADDEGPRVTWIAGGPPKATGSGAARYPPDPLNERPWPVQVGLSDATAAALRLGPGDRVQLVDAVNRDKNVTVSGVYRAVDPADAAWRLVPQLLHPVPGLDGVGSLRTAGLLSPESLPDARLAVDAEQTSVNITFSPRPTELTAGNADDLRSLAVGVVAASGARDDLQWRTGLDLVLRDIEVRIAGASAQASVLLIGLLTTVAVVLLLAADLLTRRRAATLGGVRRRGASLIDIAGELLVESVVVAALGGTAGILLAHLALGSWSWPWTTPVLLVAVAAGPALGTLAAARATRERRVPANRSARLAVLRTGQWRRFTLEAVVLVAAAGAFVALDQRGVLPAGLGDAGGNVLPAAAPTLGVVVGGLVLLRMLPPVVGVALRRAARSRRALPLVGAARIMATAARPLPLLAVVVSAALFAFTVSLAATQQAGQADGAWRTVGGDARIDVPERVSGAAVAAGLGAAHGVQAAVAAYVRDNVYVRVDGAVAYLRLVVVDPAAFRALRAATPLPNDPQTVLPAPRDGANTSALAPFRPGTHVTLKQDVTSVELTVVGAAPAVGDGEPGVLFVDAAAFAAAGGVATPNTVWVVGPGTGAAVAAIPTGSGAVTLRTDVLNARRSAPLNAGLQQLSLAAAVVMLVLGALGVALGAAAGAPSRAETLARLATLGLRPRDSRRVAASEILTPVLFGALGGTGVGLLLALAALGPLGLRLLTGQAQDPSLVVPWAPVACTTLIFVLAVAVVVGVESSRRRPERLGRALRAPT